MWCIMVTLRLALYSDPLHQYNSSEAGLCSEGALEREEVGKSWRFQCTEVIEKRRTIKEIATDEAILPKIS